MPKMRAHSSSDGDSKFRQVQDDDAEFQFNETSRPVSFYDNFKGSPPHAAMAGDNDSPDDTMVTTLNATDMEDNNNRTRDENVLKTQDVEIGNPQSGIVSWNTTTEKRKHQDSPSMAEYISTTVPVNLAASQIAGRHTPTRSSLRHSRMIVMHGHSNIPRKSRPPLLRRSKLARTLAALQIILGVSVTSLSLWLFFWAPNLPLIDNPFWSGIPLLLSGSFGVTLLCCFKKEYPGLNPGCCLSSTKIFSVLLAVLATVSCVIACASCAIHLTRLSALECTPAQVESTTCACRYRSELASPLGPVLKYVDLNCPEVEEIFTILLVFSATCNGLGAIIAGWYCYLHYSTRDNRSQYIPVRVTSARSANALDSRPIYNPKLSKR